VGSSPPLSDSHIDAESRGRPAGAPSAGGALPAAPRGGRSYLADITGHRGPRSAVVRPARNTSSAPASTANRHGVPVMTACPVPVSTTAAPPAAPLVVEPAEPLTAADSGEATWLAATLTTFAAVTPVVTAAPAQAPNTASSTPAARRSTPLVAITAASPASAATASAPASGTRSAPDTPTTCWLSGLGGVKTASAQRSLTASRISPAPTAPARSVRPYSRRTGIARTPLSRPRPGRTRRPGRVVRR